MGDGKLLKVIMEPELFKKQFSKNKQKWELMNFMSRKGFNTISFSNLPTVKYRLICGLILNGLNPFNFIGHFNEPQDSFKRLVKMTYEEHGKTIPESHSLKAIENILSNSNEYRLLRVFEYNHSKFDNSKATKELMKFRNKLTFALYTDFDGVYMIPIRVLYSKNNNLNIDADLNVLHIDSSYVITPIYEIHSGVAGLL